MCYLCRIGWIRGLEPSLDALLELLVRDATIAISVKLVEQLDNVMLIKVTLAGWHPGDDRVSKLFEINLSGVVGIDPAEHVHDPREGGVERLGHLHLSRFVYQLLLVRRFHARAVPECIEQALERLPLPGSLIGLRPELERVRPFVTRLARRVLVWLQLLVCKCSPRLELSPVDWDRRTSSRECGWERGRRARGEREGACADGLCRHSNA
mmetsp:Transcript_18466/g.46236  ORF Transcript_18466/g.46236 Transcript_18466/m.46236 type:complete len:210 (-) Transcript_18466:3-632(-)